MFSKYKSYRDILTKLKIKAQQNYYSELAVRYGNNKSKIWRLINEISNRKRKMKNNIKVLVDKDGRKLTEPTLITKCLNEHFSTVGQNMAEKFKNVESNKNPIDYITENIPHCAEFLPTTDDEISKHIMSLENKKACGYDLISNYILKSTCSTIVPFVTHLFNLCISKGAFPNCFKVAQVVPLFKGGDRKDPNCYRPISLLPALGKLLEKIVSTRALDYLNEHDLLSTHQFGFRKHFSTEYAVLDIYEKLLSNLDKKLSSCTIFLDLAKAFDSVDHGILLKKLSKYGFKDNFLHFFESYLSYRTQFVKLGAHKSSCLPIKFGVPQGSILGPLLFLVFINDLPNASRFFIKLFADDTFLCAQNSDVELLEKEVNEEINKVYEWLAANKLTLNISKSKFMIVSNKKSTLNNFQVNIKNHPLDQCDKYKYLGVIIDKNLTWKAHIEYVASKVSKVCGSLAKLRHSVNTKILIEIYHALVHSYVRYGILTWGNASDTALNLLQVILNRAVRIITFAPFGRIDVSTIFKELGILDAKNTFFLEKSKFLYKKEYNMLPVTLAQYFEQTSEVASHSYNLRSNNGLNTIVTRLASSQNSIQINGNQLWNKIPDSTKLFSSFNLFKRDVKKMLLEGIDE